MAVEVIYDQISTKDGAGHDDRTPDLLNTSRTAHPTDLAGPNTCTILWYQLPVDEFPNNLWIGCQTEMLLLCSPLQTIVLVQS